VATHVSHAKRFSQVFEVAEGIQIKLTADYADFADQFSVAVALWATCASHPPSHSYGAASSEAATAEDWANCQVEADSVATAATLLPVDAAARPGLAV
jgi:hypothetical protein